MYTIALYFMNEHPEQITRFKEIVSLKEYLLLKCKIFINKILKGKINLEEKKN